jgi:hypothetical protein
MELGWGLALDVFGAWRRDLDCVDALILLVITLANVDGVLFNRQLRTRYGGTHPIAPNNLRQPIASSVIALSLGLSPSFIDRRIRRLAARGECETAPGGMVITEQQVEHSDRLATVCVIYEQLRSVVSELDAFGLSKVLAGLPSGATQTSPLRSSAAHAGKYVLRTLDAVAPHTGDVRDTLLLMAILRAEWAGAITPGTSADFALQLGLRPDEARSRAKRLVENGLFARADDGRLIADPVATRPWFRDLERRNLDNLFQLFAGLADVGALAEFAGVEPCRLTPAQPTC